MNPTQNPSPAPHITGAQSIDDVPAFKRKRVIIPLFLLLIVLVAGGWYWYVQKYTFVATDDAMIDADRATISSKMLGRIVQLKFDEGDSVRQGDTLVRLDDADLQAQLTKAEASVRYLTRSAEIAAVNLDKAADDFKRIARQFESQIVSQEQYNHSENARKLAEAASDMSASQIATAQAELAIVKTQLNNAVIVAPFSGVIAKRWVLQGDVVQPGQAIYALYDVEHVWVTANYEETKLRAIHPGAAVRIAVDAYPGADLAGRVLSIGTATAAQFSLIPASNAAGNFTKITQRVPVKIAVESPHQNDIRLLPGLSASVRVFPR
jgi:membrane fusion protein (multidrug efflux system)